MIKKYRYMYLLDNIKILCDFKNFRLIPSIISKISDYFKYNLIRIYNLNKICDWRVWKKNVQYKRYLKLLITLIDGEYNSFNLKAAHIHK